MATVRAGAARGLLAYVEANGGSCERVLAAAGLSRRDLADEDRLIAIEPMLRLHEAAADELADDDFGLHFGEARDLGNLGVLGYALLHAPTVGAALRNFERYHGFHLQGARVHFEVVGGRALIRADIPVADYALCRHYTETSAVELVRLLRHLFGAAWSPASVRFGHRAPRDLGEHARLLGAPLLFEQPVQLEFAFDSQDIEREVNGADPALLRLVEHHLEARVPSSSGGPWLAEVRQAIAQAFASGRPTAQAIGKRLGMSVRTLQRRLEEQGVSFQELADEVRRSLADQYLAQSQLDFGEVAFLLGYSDLSSFHRAFQRWTGMTPRERRLSLRGSAAQ